MKQMKSVKDIESERKNFFAPENVRTKDRIELAVGDTITVIGVTLSVFQKRDKETKEYLFYDDGEPMFGATAYLELDDDHFTSVNGRVAIDQILSLYDEPPSLQTVGSYPLVDMEPLKLRCVKVMQKYGKDEFPKIAFDTI